MLGNTRADPGRKANTADTDQSAPEADLGLHCLPIPCRSENLGSLQYFITLRQDNLGDNILTWIHVCVLCQSM